MDHTNKYMVWWSDNHAEYVRADEVIFSDTTVSFMVGDHVTASYFLEDFLKFNSVDIKPVGVDS